MCSLAGGPQAEGGLYIDSDSSDDIEDNKAVRARLFRFAVPFCHTTILCSQLC